jgi:hypothetical protein
MFTIMKGKGKVVPVQASKAYTIVKIQLQAFLTSALYGTEWSTSHPGHPTPGKQPRCPLNRRPGRPQSQSRYFGE